MTLGHLFIAVGLLILVLSLTDVIAMPVAAALIVATVLGLIGALIDR